MTSPSDRISDDRLDRIETLARTLSVDLDLPGRWRWGGNLDNNSGPALQTNGHGGQYILGCDLRHRHITYTPEYDDVEKVEDADCPRGDCPHERTEWETWEDRRMAASLDWPRADGEFLALDEWCRTGETTGGTYSDRLTVETRERIDEFEAADHSGGTHAQDDGMIRFRVQREGDPFPHLVDGHKIPVFEVCRDATSADDKRVYRRDIVGFRSPVAEYVAELDSDTVLALVEEVRTLRTLIAPAQQAPTRPLRPVEAKRLEGRIPPEVTVGRHGQQDIAKGFARYVECNEGCGFLIGVGDAVDTASHASCIDWNADLDPVALAPSA